MLIKALLAAAAVSSIAGAAFAAPDYDKGQDVTAQSTPTDQTQPASSAGNSVPATAVTPSANVASSTTTVDENGATVTTQLITNGPVPDTPQNRARYGQPLSHAGRMTAPKGN